ncbi:hypothetical protein UlMin_012583 [Ulmus minor]
MHDSKPVSLPLASHFKLDDTLSPITDEEKKSVAKIPYNNAIGSLMYTMVSTRPNLSFAMSVLSRYMCNLGKKHWEAAKWLFRYIKGTSNVGLVYGRNGGTKLKLEGFVDADYAGNKDNKRSTIAYVFCLNGCCISWKSQLQPIVALSTTEAKYIATTEAIKEALCFSF